MRGVVVDNCLQLFPHNVGGLLRHDLPLYLCLVLQHDVSVGIHHMVYHMRRYHIAAVDGSRICSHQFHGGHLITLTVCRRGKVDDVHIIAGDAVADCLAGQVDSGLFRQTKSLKIIAELIDADALSDLDERRVTGVGQRLCKVLCAVSGSVGAANGRICHLNLPPNSRNCRSPY